MQLKSGHLLQNACHKNVMKLEYKVIKEKYNDNNTYIFCSKKLVTMVTPTSSHVKDKNSIAIFTARDEDMIF